MCRFGEKDGRIIYLYADYGIPFSPEIVATNGEQHVGKCSRSA